MTRERARAIMGKNFLGLEEVKRGYGIELGCVYPEIPFDEETLRECKDTHVLFAGAPLSVNDINKRFDSEFRKTNPLNSNCHSMDKKVSDEKVSVRWHLLRKEPLPGSLGKAYDRETANLSKKEMVPFAREVTYMIILYWFTHRERLLQNIHVYCRDMIDDHYHVTMGFFDSDDFDSDDFPIFGIEDGRGSADIGLASARQF